MDMYGATPLEPSEGQNIVRCKDCDKPIFESAVPLHAGKSPALVACPVHGEDRRDERFSWTTGHGVNSFCGVWEPLQTPGCTSEGGNSTRGAWRCLLAQCLLRSGELTLFYHQSIASKCENDSSTSPTPVQAIQQQHSASADFPMVCLPTSIYLPASTHQTLPQLLRTLLPPQQRSRNRRSS